MSKRTIRIREQLSKSLCVRVLQASIFTIWFCKLPNSRLESLYEAWMVCNVVAAQLPCILVCKTFSSNNYRVFGWLGSRVVNVLDSGAEGSGFKSQSRRCRVTLVGKLFAPIVSVYQVAKLVAALLRVARVTAGLVKSNGSLPPGLWLTSRAGWLPRTGISSGTLRSVIEYGLPLSSTQCQIPLTY